MNLTDAEKRMLDGKEGEVRAWAMDKLVKLGEFYGAPDMVDVAHAHIAPVFPGAEASVLKVFEETAKKGGKFKTTTSTDPEVFDSEKPEALGIGQESIEFRQRVMNALLTMGAIPTRTCTIYWSGLVPRMGEHLAWNESSAVPYANSLLGARGNFDSQIGSLLSALTAKTPKIGYHLDENRRGNVLVRLDFVPGHLTDWDALGLYLTQVLSSGSVPVFINMPKTVRVAELKRMNSSLGYGLGPGIGLWHAVGITPEAGSVEQACGGKSPKETVVVTPKEIRKVYELTEWHGPVDMVHFGCPHLGIEEMGMVASLFQGKRVRSNVRTWVFTSPAVKLLSDHAGYTATLQKAGVEVFTGACATCIPKKEAAQTYGGKVQVTDSGKHWNLAPSLMGDTGLKTVLRTTEQAVQAALTGGI